jgi:DNA replication and repair protein RecF
MKITHLELTHFRNYDHLALDFDSNLNIFLGQNAQGKTNVVESLYFLSLARSHRTSSDRELIQWGADEALVTAQVEKRAGSVPLEMSIGKKGLVTRVNHLTQRRLSDFVGQLNVIMFAPEDLQLIKSGPSGRRKFMDVEISKIRPLYLADLVAYNKTLKERNALLKFDRAKLDLAFLDVLDMQLVEYGKKIIGHRQDFIQRLSALARETHTALSNELEALILEYAPNVTSQDFETKLTAARDKDLFRKQTSVGPHRDDLRFIVNDVDVANFGSQGQQRTTILSVKLAEIDLIHQETLDYPILILDDVMSELDNQRQSMLLKTALGKTQTFLTTTTLDHLTDLPEELQIFNVDHGHANLAE